MKRRIDTTNQLRNDLAEELDRVLLDWLAPRQLPNPDAPLHSESPGLIIDRLSILALKIYHTREEAERREAPAGHAERNSRSPGDSPGTARRPCRTASTHCGARRWPAQRRFKLYRQLKMYNDPTLNPAIYGKARTRCGISEPDRWSLWPWSLVPLIDEPRGYAYKEGSCERNLKRRLPPSTL